MTVFYSIAEKHLKELMKKRKKGDEGEKQNESEGM
jgi:hypothetical protein